jgi:serine/threonine protein kinase
VQFFLWLIAVGMILAARLWIDFLSGAMEVTQFLRFAVGLATALSSLHERKLIHKDLKPANVLVIPLRVRSG